jgi:dolichol-phosphate mannosyltransferase
MITIVIPVFEEADHLEESVLRICSVLEVAQVEHDLVLVDDGSQDGTWGVMERLAEIRPRVTVVRLSRNFGKEAALCAGLETARGDAVITIDADLQHPPELMLEMVGLWREQRADVVEAVKIDRGPESLSKRWTSELFYWLFMRLSGVDLRGASDFKLMDRCAVDAWCEMRERNTFYRGMSAWLGFRRIRLPFSAAERSAGRTKWSTATLMRLSLRALTSFSSLPLQLISVLGLVLFLASLVLGVQTLWMKLSCAATTGFTTVILLQLLIGSAIMFSLGVIGTYLARIHDEVKARPRYIVASRIDGSTRLQR